MRKEDVASTYRLYAPIYDATFGRILKPGLVRMAEVVRELNPRSLLEVGVGTGLNLPNYPPTASIHGIDICEHMLSRARLRAARQPERAIQLHLMDAEDLTFADDSFDCITVPYVLSVTPNPKRLTSELRRVCRKDGHIIVVNHFSGSHQWRLLEQLAKPLASKIGFRSDFDFTTHIEGEPWSVESCEAVNLFGLSKLLVIRNA